MINHVHKSLPQFARPWSAISARSKAPSKPKGEEMNEVLSLLVKSDEHTDPEFVAHIPIVITAGHATISSALCWAAYLLSLHP